MDVFILNIWFCNINKLNLLVMVVIKLVMVLMIRNLLIILKWMSVFFVFSVCRMVSFCWCLFILVCIWVNSINEFVISINININFIVNEIWLMILCIWLIWVFMLNKVIEVNGCISEVILVLWLLFKWKLVM